MLKQAFACARAAGFCDPPKDWLLVTTRKEGAIYDFIPAGSTPSK